VLSAFYAIVLARAGFGFFKISREWYFWVLTVLSYLSTNSFFLNNFFTLLAMYRATEMPLSGESPEF